MTGTADTEEPGSACDTGATVTGNSGVGGNGLGDEGGGEPTVNPGSGDAGGDGGGGCSCCVGDDGLGRGSEGCSGGKGDRGESDIYKLVSSLFSLRSSSSYCLFLLF